MELDTEYSRLQFDGRQLLIYFDESVDQFIIIKQEIKKIAETEFSKPE